MQITIRDVAKRAGISPAIVSRVVNKDALLSIKEETRKRVEEAVVALNYIPNPIARGLRRSSTSTIGMIVPDIANPFFTDIIKGAQDVSIENGLFLILFNTDEDWENEKKSIEILARQKVDGILYLSAHLDFMATRMFEQIKMPYVLVNRNTVDINTSFVGLDNINGAMMAVEYLAKLGHTKIAHISGPLHTDTGSGRLQGYRKGLLKLGIKHEMDYLVEAPFSFDGGYKAINKLLSLEDKPSAIFAANDLIAMGSIAGAASMSVKVPRDLSIIGFNNIWVAPYCMPPLTTISFDNYKMGYEACKMLIKTISEPSQIASKLILEPKLVVRQSTAHYKNNSASPAYFS
jgi:DNA-binding LacI/PurR family transcriptional regulator